jgi:hypothetical protein
MPIYHSKTVTIADDADTNIVRPSDWNSNHAVALSSDEIVKVFSAGIESISSGTLVFSNSNGLAFGLNAGTLTGSYSQSTHSHSSLVFSNSNGVVFGVNGSTLTASVGTNYAGVGETVATVAGTDLAMTVDTAGVNIGYPKWITTAMLSNAGSNFAGLGETVATVAGTDLALTVDSNGVNIGYPKWITTAMASNAGSNFAGLGETVGTIAGTDLAMTVATNGVSVGYAKWITTAMVSNGGSNFAGLGETVGTIAGTDLAMTVDSNGVNIGYPKWITTAMASNRGTDFVAASAAFAGTNASGTIASNGISVSVAAPGGAGTLTNCFEPFDMQDGTATLSGSLSQLNLQPFTLPNNQSFGQINFFGIATVVPTSASNSISGRQTNSTNRWIFSTNYTIGNTNIVDWFLFRRGSGVYSSELETYSSTRNSFATNYRATYWGDVTLTDTAGGSLRGSQTISMTISYPFLTSYTSTSIAGGSSYTGWSSGYTTWTSAANNSSSFTYSTSAARTLSIGSTYPATVGWSGAKRINMNFAASLSQGEWWLGYLRHSSSSASSSSANSFTGAAATNNSYSATFNSTAYANTMQLTFAGKTVTVVNSLGSLGFITTANMAIEPGLGSFSGTWASNTTYLNNLGNPVGAIALTQIRSNVSFFRSWFQLASNMPV